MSTPARRKFLAAAAGVVTLPALIEAAEPRREQPKDTFGGFTIGIQSYSYRKFSFERALEQIEKLGVDRKSTRLNSSHRCISYAVFCLKKKKISKSWKW